MFTTTKNWRSGIKHSFPTVVTVDVGGTWLRAKAERSDTHRILWKHREPACPPREIPRVLRALLRKRRLHPDKLLVGSTGIWTQKQKSTLARAMKNLASKAEVLSDVELAWWEAFHGKPGIIVIAGTGSCVYGRDACGHSARAGGLGPLLGDEGSAFWIGREWLRLQPKRALKFAHHPRPVRAIASVAREVFALASKNPKALQIIRQAKRDLMLQLRVVRRALHFQKRVPNTWHGGIAKKLSMNASTRRKKMERLWELRGKIALDIDLKKSRGR